MTDGLPPSGSSGQQFIFVVSSELAEQGAWIEVTLRPHPDQIAALAKATNPLPKVGLTLPALVDTGAGLTCIQDRIAKDLGFRQVGRVCLSGVHDHDTCGVYLADIQLGPWRQSWKVVGLRSRRSSPIPCILGRDILQFFTLFYVGPENCFGLYQGVPPFVKGLMKKSHVLTS